MRRRKKNKLPRRLMNQFRKRKIIKKKKKKLMTKNKNLLKKEMTLMNKVLQNMQTMRILVIMQARNSFLKKVYFLNKNKHKNKMNPPRMMKNLKTNKQQKIQK